MISFPNDMAHRKQHVKMTPAQRQALGSEPESKVPIQAQPAQHTDPLMTHPSSSKTMLSDPPTQKGTIGILPEELQEEIFSNLSWDAAIQLSSTNKWYQFKINPEEHASDDEKQEFLHHQEQKDRFCSENPAESFFACTGCWRLKSEMQFNVSQVYNDYNKDGNLWDLRRCLDCQIKDGGYYGMGQRVADGTGRTLRLCCKCNAFRGGLFCTTCNLCETCLKKPKERCTNCDKRLVKPIETLYEGGRLFYCTESSRTTFIKMEKEGLFGQRGFEGFVL